jgi:transposase
VGAMLMYRKIYSNDFKQKLVKEAMDIGNISAVARQHDVSRFLLAKWVQKENNPYKPKEPTRSKNDLELENQKLKNILGEKDLQIAILEELLKKTKRT